jgi:hypothetical protein
MESFRCGHDVWSRQVLRVTMLLSGPPLSCMGSGRWRFGQGMRQLGVHCATVVIDRQRWRRATFSSAGCTYLHGQSGSE